MGPSTRVVYLCDWLPPDFGAVGQYELAAARRRAQEGQLVTLVGFNSQYSSEETGTEGQGRLVVRRVHRPAYDRTTWIKRAFWTVHSNLSLIWHARREIARADEIRFTGSPPYLIHFVMPLAWLLRKPTRYRISDFHPECLIATLGRTPWWVRPIHAMTLFWRRRVTIFEVLGEDQKRRLITQGIPRERIRLIRDSTPIEITGQESGCLRPAEMAGRFILLYSGNWGRAHDSETFVQAIRGLEPGLKSKLGIWLNCIGKESVSVYNELSAEPGLVVLHTLPLPLSDLPDLLASADCHLITLKDAFVGYVLPSKVYGCIASGKPILYIGSRDSDVHLLCAQRMGYPYYQSDCGDWRRVGAIIEKLASGAHPK